MKTGKNKHRIILVTGLLVLVLVLTAGVCPAAQSGFVIVDTEQDTQKLEEARKLYRDAQKALNREQYKEAVRYFQQVHDQYKDSKYAADALYWQAFALYRLGTKRDLRDARSALERQMQLYQEAATYDDAQALYYRVLGQLAKLGDSDAAKQVAERAENQLEKNESRDKYYDQETKMAALHALMNMKSERAVPILKKILQDKDPDKAELREQALFLLTQHHSEESVDLLMDLARTDPNPDVRKQAVFWLSRAEGDNATDFLVQLLEETDDPEMQEQAIFALSQHGGKKANQALQKIALDEDASKEARQNSIFWLGQKGGSEEIDFLKDLYDKVDEHSLKESIIFSVYQNSKGKSAGWLMEIVHDEDESIDIRKTALHWVGQHGSFNLEKLRELYNTIPEREMREQVIFVLSQRSEKQALDIMIDLARKEKNPELRKQLVFWIGQSNDSRAEDFLLDIIND